MGGALCGRGTITEHGAGRTKERGNEKMRKSKEARGNATLETLNVESIERWNGKTWQKNNGACKAGKGKQGK